MKIVINDCFGGFSLSDAGVLRYAEIKGISLYSEMESAWGTSFFTVDEENGNYKLSNEVYFCSRSIKRDDPVLIRVVEEMGHLADGELASLRVVEIPDGIEWEIEEYDGNETVHEKHRSWS